MVVNPPAPNKRHLSLSKKKFRDDFSNNLANLRKQFVPNNTSKILTGRLAIFGLKEGKEKQAPEKACAQDIFQLLP